MQSKGRVERARGALGACALLAGGLCAPAAAASSQGATAPAGQEPEWRNYVALYFMGAAQDGDVTLHGLEADLDVGFDEIVEYLDFGAMAAWRGETRDWFVSVDAVYMELGADETRNAVTVEASYEQLVVEADVGVRVTPQFDAFVGARFWHLDGDVDLSGPGPGASSSGSEYWLDPVVGAHFTLPFSDSWSLVLRGDVGGFGLGSEFTWQGLARLDWKLSPNVSLDLGYRAIYVDYEEGSGTDEFVYDVTTSGPLLGVIFGF